MKHGPFIQSAFRKHQPLIDSIGHFYNRLLVNISPTPMMQPNVFLPFDAEITRPCGNIVCGNIMRGKIVQYPIIRLQVCNLAIFQWVEILFLFPLHFVKDLADNEIICLSINISIFTEGIFSPFYNCFADFKQQVDFVCQNFRPLPSL